MPQIESSESIGGRPLLNNETEWAYKKKSVYGIYK